MTLQESWDTSINGSGMMDDNESWIETQRGSRKASLLVIAYARSVWHLVIEADLNDLSEWYGPGRHRELIDSCSSAIDSCERAVEGVATHVELAALTEMEHLDRSNHGPYLSLALGEATQFAIDAFGGDIQVCYSFGRPCYEQFDRLLADLFRDIFGNPFRPVVFDPAWHTEHTIGMAAKMYDDRDFAAMPILADAPEDAGCDSETILTHCREPGVHVRGCWVVDLVLGKS